MKSYILVSFLVVSLSFISCSKDASSSDTPEEAFELKLVGTWQLQSEMKNGESITLDSCVKQSTIVVAQNNIDFVHSYYDFNVALDECTLEGSPSGRISPFPNDPAKKLVMDYSDGNGNPIFTYILSNTTLKLIRNMDDGENSKTYIKLQ